MTKIDELIAQAEAMVNQYIGQLNMLRQMKQAGWTVEAPKPDPIVEPKETTDG